jgi:hypothetical protein
VRLAIGEGSRAESPRLIPIAPRDMNAARVAFVGASIGRPHVGTSCPPLSHTHTGGEVIHCRCAHTTTGRGYATLVRIPTDTEPAP